MAGDSSSSLEKFGNFLEEKINKVLDEREKKAEEAKKTGKQDPPDDTKESFLSSLFK